MQVREAMKCLGIAAGAAIWMAIGVSGPAAGMGNKCLMGGAEVRGGWVVVRRAVGA
jgi:hypothetical protein